MAPSWGFRPNVLQKRTIENTERTNNRPVQPESLDLSFEPRRPIEHDSQSRLLRHGSGGHLAAFLALLIVGSFLFCGLFMWARFFFVSSFPFVGSSSFCGLFPFRGLFYLMWALSLLWALFPFVGSFPFSGLFSRLWAPSSRTSNGVSRRGYITLSHHESRNQKILPLCTVPDVFLPPEVRLLVQVGAQQPAHVRERRDVRARLQLAVLRPVAVQHAGVNGDVKRGRHIAVARAARVRVQQVLKRMTGCVWTPIWPVLWTDWTDSSVVDTYETP